MPDGFRLCTILHNMCIVPLDYLTTPRSACMIDKDTMLQ